jgi:hypothetical protein
LAPPFSALAGTGRKAEAERITPTAEIRIALFIILIFLIALFSITFEGSSDFFIALGLGDGFGRFS